MNKTIIRIMGLACTLVIIYFVMSLVANVSQLASAADRVYSGLGQPVFWALIVLLTALLVTPIALFYKLPKPLIPPEEKAGAAHEEYLQRLKANLKSNPLLNDMVVETESDVVSALNKLNVLTDKAIKDTAGAVFVSTAVMQNGRLDGLIVLMTQLRMIWRIASIYYQRPSPRQVFYLYGNVGANVLVADSIQEIQFAEITTPIVTAIFPSLKGAIPGMQGVASLLVNSLANGAANAFLTLRVGIISRDYCSSLWAQDNSQLRRSASAAALSLVGDIAKEQGARVVKGAWEAVSGTVGNAVNSTMQATKNAARKSLTTTVDGVKSTGKGIARSFDNMKNIGKQRDTSSDDLHPEISTALM
ncbi:MAG: DUF697 domain-containing protein [Burkholderiaceae bacterium]|nr:DUF697 domain-containing protein [Burkholderiaceae bacterium]